MNESEARVEICVTCQGREFERDAAVPVERAFGDVRVAVAARGDRCVACGAAYVPAAALEAAESLITTELVARGVGGPEAARWLRKGAGLAADELAALLDVDPAAVRAWEAEGGAPTRATLAVLGALASDALDGVTTTRDRLRAAGHPPAGTVRIRAA